MRIIERIWVGTLSLAKLFKENPTEFVLSFLMFLSGATTFFFAFCLVDIFLAFFLSNQVLQTLEIIGIFLYVLVVGYLTLSSIYYLGKKQEEKAE